MGYAIAGLYIILAGILTQLFLLTEKLGRLESKIDNIVPRNELEEFRNRIEKIEKQLTNIKV